MNPTQPSGFHTPQKIDLSLVQGSQPQASIGISALKAADHAVIADYAVKPNGSMRSRADQYDRASLGHDAFVSPSKTPLAFAALERVCNQLNDPVRKSDVDAVIKGFEDKFRDEDSRVLESQYNRAVNDPGSIAQWAGASEDKVPQAVIAIENVLIDKLIARYSKQTVGALKEQAGRFDKESEPTPSMTLNKEVIRTILDGSRIGPDEKVEKTSTEVTARIIGAKPAKTERSGLSKFGRKLGKGLKIGAAVAISLVVIPVALATAALAAMVIIPVAVIGVLIAGVYLATR